MWVNTRFHDTFDRLASGDDVRRHWFTSWTPHWLKHSSFGDGASSDNTLPVGSQFNLASITWDCMAAVAAAPA